MKVSLVPVTHIDTAWRTVGPILQSAIASSEGRHSPDDVRAALREGKQQLWIAYNDDGVCAAATTMIVDYPSKRVLSAMFLAGTRMKEWADPLESLLSRFASDHGCSAMEMTGRRGWTRFLRRFGWKPAASVVEKPVTPAPQVQQPAPPPNITFMDMRADDRRVERFREFFQNDRDALQLIWTIRMISHVWDDLVDNDKPVPQSEINGAFWSALFTLNENPFWERHSRVLLPVLKSAALEWIAANELEQDTTNPLSREVSHVCRFSAGNIALLIMEIIGGTQWAASHAAEVKLMMMDEPFADYVFQLEASK